MIQIYLSEEYCHSGLRPLSLTTPIADIRVGIFTLKEKWSRLLGPSSDISTDCQKKDERITIPAHVVPFGSDFLRIIDFYSSHDVTQTHKEFLYLNHPWELFQINDRAIREDFTLFIDQSKANLIHQSHLINSEHIFIEEGAQITNAVLNASTGPIYIGRNAVIMEGTTVRGPFVLSEGSVVKMGTRIYGATTIGRYSVVGGEVKNVIIGDYSAKAHEGYIGDSVIGNWCNLGAGTTSSNMKNNASNIRVKFASDALPEIAGLKCGLIMGDFSRTAINTSFNTGSVVGICCNIFGNQPPLQYTDHFTWGQEQYKFDKAILDVSNWMELRQQELSNSTRDQLKKIHQLTKQYS